ncbi:hypothetical protein AB0903_25565 [Streptomyces sp. NPDC048389]|uniref:hypothetical protein n=1 Tax=Streptomyces sp. NPDC048389 TaxID=3154622 RepID=UPI0034544FB4
MTGPVGRALLPAAQAAVLVVLLAGAWAAGSPDDLGRAGRALTVVCPGGTESPGPWPGSYYGLPLLGLLATATALCACTLRRIVLTTADDGPGLRQRARTVTAAWGFLVTTPLAGASLFMSVAMRSISCLDGPAHVLAWTLTALTPLAAISAVWCLTAMIPTRR